MPPSFIMLLPVIKLVVTRWFERLFKITHVGSAAQDCAAAFGGDLHHNADAKAVPDGLPEYERTVIGWLPW